MYDTLIIDGSNMAYKAFSIHGNFSAEVNGNVIYTGVTFGFISSLLSLRRAYLNDGGKIFVCWDKGYEHRLKLYPEYKANRRQDTSKQEDYLKYKKQRSVLMKVLPHFGITQVYKNGYEADDVAGSLAFIRRDNFNETILIVSGDHDYNQLIDEDIDLCAHKGRGNIKVYDLEKFKKTHEITPLEYYYTMCLTGDSGDNVPGVKGFGEKTATKLVKNNPQLLPLLLNKKLVSEESFNGSTKEFEKILDNIETIIISSKLVKIVTDLKKLSYIKSNKDLEKMEDICEMLEFNHFLTSETWKQLKEL